MPAKMTVMQQRMNVARNYKDLYQKLEDNFSGTVPMRAGPGTRRQVALMEQIRGQDIFGDVGAAGVMSGGAVLSQPYRGGAVRRNMFGVMKQTFREQPAIRPNVKELGKTRAKMNALSPFYSTWVKRLGYDKPTQTIYAMLGDTDKGEIPKDFYWSPVPELIFKVWFTGANRCKTTEKVGTKNKNYGSHLRRERLVKMKSTGRYNEQGQPRYWKGKRPSMGAAYYLVGKYLAGKRV